MRNPPAYGSSTERPADFDDFWAHTLEAANRLPLDPSLVPVPHRSTEHVEVFEIAYTSYQGLRIAGWYCRPRSTYLPPPYPALLIVPGYISEPTLPKSWAKLGYAAIGVAPRGKLRSNQRFNPGYPGLLVHNIVDRETYGYRGFYVDACRAVDFAKTLPEVDTRRIGVHGSSQGGALTITTAALRRDAITCAAAGAPYLCGFMDAIKLTHTYPYEEINEYLRRHPDREHRVRDTVAYYDGHNFAPMIQCPTMVYMGEEDDVCPPETGYALFARLACEKELQTSPRCAHEAGRHWMGKKVADFLAKHLQPGASSSPAELAAH
ncbi:MAG: acetylxylan esterase [Chloroflexota bacterium]